MKKHTDTKLKGRNLSTSPCMAFSPPLQANAIRLPSSYERRDQCDPKCMQWAAHRANNEVYGFGKVLSRLVQRRVSVTHLSRFYV